MPRLRRVGEQLGYGYTPSNEDLSRVRMAELRRLQEQTQEEDESRFAQDQQRRWSQAGATRAPRNMFNPQTRDEYEQYSPYDVHSRTVRRMRDADDYDTGSNDIRISGIPNGMHIMDDVGLLEDILMESIDKRKSKIDQERLAREAKALDDIAWEEAQLSRMGLHKEDGTRMSGSNMTSGRVVRTANERDASSGFGLRDYASMEVARERHQRMMDNVADRKNSIRRKFASPEEQRMETFDRERQRASTIQERFANSQMLGNLSDRIAEMDEMQNGRYSSNDHGQMREYYDYEKYYGRRATGDHRVNYI